MIDLHCHTKVSDGSMPPFELIRLAKLHGVTHLAITDHDTTQGVPESLRYGQMLGVEIISGIEISAHDYRRNHRAHILGLGVEAGHPVLEHLCRPLIEQRQQASFETVERLREAGYNVTWDEVEKYAAGGTGVYKQHIMGVLVDHGYCRHIHSSLYRQLFGAANQNYPAGSATVRLKHPDVLLAIAAVKAAGGVAVLAHPGLYHNFEAVTEWVDAGLQGIEAYHPDHTVSDMDMALTLAARFNLVVTGGTDYHGIYDEKPRNLGCSKLDSKSIPLLKNRMNDYALCAQCG